MPTATRSWGMTNGGSSEIQQEIEKLKDIDWSVFIDTGYGDASVTIHDGDAVLVKFTTTYKLK